jgi:hypothetical protein
MPASSNSQKTFTPVDSIIRFVDSEILGPIPSPGIRVIVYKIRFLFKNDKSMRRDPIIKYTKTRREIQTLGCLDNYVSGLIVPCEFNLDRQDE